MHNAPSVFLNLGHQNPMYFLGHVLGMLDLARSSWFPDSLLKVATLGCGTTWEERNREGPGLLNLRRTLVGKRPEMEGVRGAGGGFDAAPIPGRGDATRVGVWFRDPSSIRFK